MAADSGPGEELLGIFARVSGMLLSEATVATALSTVTSLAADAIAGSAGSGVSLLDADGGSPRRRPIRWSSNLTICSMSSTRGHA
jgi:hypothetical protein